MVSYRQGLDQPLRGLDEPVLLDEWQEVPEVMGAVRRSVDGDPRPGRFLLMAAPGPRRTADAWSGIGRVVPIKMFGLAEREFQRVVSGQGLLDR